MSHPSNDAYQDAMREAYEETLTDQQWAHQQEQEAQRWWEDQDKDEAWIKAVTRACDNRYLKCQ